MNAIAGTMDEPHYVCSRPDYEPVSTMRDVQAYLTKAVVKTLRNDYVSCYTSYRIFMEKGQRFGQAFMNALPEEDYDHLTGTLLDPFNKLDQRSVLIALDYLLFSKEH